MTHAAAVDAWCRRVRQAVSASAQDGPYPVATVRRLLDLGVQRIPVGVDLGGEGLGLRGLVAVLEELAAADGSVAAIMMGLYSATAFLAACDRAARLAPLLAGEGIAAVAVTEPGAGTDAAAIRTTCRRTADGGWRLDGEKAFISNTGHPLWRQTIVLARGPMADGFTAFLVPSDAAGLRVARPRATIGWSRTGVHDLVFDAVRVDDADRLGEPGGGLRLALATFDRGRVAVAALAAGLCRAAWQQADGHARQRRSFGKPLIAHPAVADHVVALWRLYTRARRVTAQAAAVADAGGNLTPWAALAKWEATDAAVEAARRAVQVLGGRGLLREGRVAELWGDAKALEVVEGTTEAQGEVLRRRLQRGPLPDPPDEGSAPSDAAP